MNEEQISGLRLHDNELSAFEFSTAVEAANRLRPHVWRRVAAAIDALNGGAVQYLKDGYV